MKKLFIQSFLVSIALLMSTAILAQDTITVDQGLGTLEAAIAANGGDKVYKLTAGSWYGLNSIVEVSDSTLGGVGKELTIVGEETDGMPAIIQVGVDGEGAVFPWLFQAFNNLTLKNIFLSAQDFSGVQGPGVIGLQDSIRLIVDNCVIDPSGINRSFGGGDPADGSKFYLTNSQIYRNGHMQGPNDGGWLGGMQWDTLWVENNTFVSSGQDFIGTPFHSVPHNNFIWINHNTFLWHDVWIKKSYNDQNFYFTNNLMQDISIYSQLYAWGQFFPDYKQGNTMLSLLCIDTLETFVDTAGNKTYETLPSDRNMFWQYNLQWNTPQLLSIVQHGADSAFTPIYAIPMKWDEDTPLSYTAGDTVQSPADSSRETRILADKANWPNMKYNNNWYDQDPQWTDPMIEQINDSMHDNILSWWRDIIWDRPGAVFDGTPSYNWNIDDWNGTDPSEFPVVWPRFDGTYGNTTLQEASIEGLPIGDLNWWPDAKARWAAEKDAIRDHILALNESQYQLATNIQTVQMGALKVYPNPANNILLIESESGLVSLRIHDITGKLIEEINMANRMSEQIDISAYKEGVYILKAKSISGENLTAKIVKTR